MTLDRRLNVFRPDLADMRLQGQVEAERYGEGAPARIQTRFADLHPEPDTQSGIDTQALYGDVVSVFDEADGWSWIQCQTNRYVGYVRSEALGPVGNAATHMVLAPRTYLYSKADLKSPRAGFHSMGALLTITGKATTRGTNYLICDDGAAAIANHLVALDVLPRDPVSVALTLLHTPYLWGGTTGFGIDCSGLVALAHRLCGNTVLRDSDMQAATFGSVVETRDFHNLKRGDLVFWKGHVGMMVDATTMLHANGHTMNVALEPLAEAIARIGYLYGQATHVRRMD